MVPTWVLAWVLAMEPNLAILDLSLNIKPNSMGIKVHYGLNGSYGLIWPHMASSGIQGLIWHPGSI